MANIWISGAKGFIGGHLAQRLSVSAHQLSGIGHGAWPEAEAVRSGLSNWLNAEITSSSLNILQASSGLPDVIYHLAGGSAVSPSIENPLEDFNRTVGTTARLLDWVRCASPDTLVVLVSCDQRHKLRH